MSKESTFVAWVGIYAPRANINTLMDLADANLLLKPLLAASKICFADVTLEPDTAGNWILMKTNLVALMNAMTQFAVNYLHAQSDMDLTKVINATVIAKKEGPEELLVLCEHIAALAVLANNLDIIATLKTLPKEQQTVLSGSVKRIIALYNLRKATNLPTTAAHADIAQANRDNAAATSASRMSSPVFRPRDDDVKLQAEIGVLRNEVRDKTGSLQLSESKLEMAESQLQELQARYRALLEETQSKGPSMRERELHQAVSDKEHVIQGLTLEVTEMRSKAQQAKVAQTDLNDEIATLKKSLEETKASLKNRTEEKQDAMAKLVLAKDQLQIGNQRRDEMEGELIRLRDQTAQFTIATPRRIDRSLNVESSFDAAQQDDQAAMSDEVEELRRLLNIRDAEIAMIKKLRGTSANNENEDPEALSPEELLQELDEKLEAAQCTIKAQEDRIHDLLEDQKESATTFAMKIEMAKAESSAGGSSEEWEELKAEKEKLQVEAERAKRHLVAAQEEIETIRSEQLTSGESRKQLEDYRRKMDEGMKAMRAEQAVVTSVVFQVGHRNLALQQRNLLGGTAVPHILKDEAYTTVFKGSAVQNRKAPKSASSFGWLMADSDAESAAMKNPTAAFDSADSLFDSILGAPGGDNAREGAAGNSTDGFMTTSRIRGVWGSFLGSKK